VAFRFRIRLHKDDLSSLEYIKYMLGVGLIRIEGDSAIYKISKLKDLIEIIIPLFSTYPLLNKKDLDFESFKQARDIKKKSNTSKLSLEDLNSIMDIKSNMNRNRIVIESTLSEMTLSNFRSSTKINIYWLLGFVEGDCTFGIKILVPYFQVAQHNKNISVLNLIKNFLAKLAINSSIPKGVTPLNSISIFTNKKNKCL
jgi:hypothetical protein